MKSISRFKHLLFTGLGVGLFLTVGCADNSVVGANRGTAIDSNNADQVQREVDDQLTRAAVRGPGTYQGAHSGQVRVEPSSAGKVATEADAEAVVRLRIALHQYSEDGTLFLDGIVNYERRGRGNAHYQGTLTLSGRYEGQAEVDITVTKGQMKGKYKVVGRNKVKITIEIPCRRDGETADSSGAAADSVRAAARTAVKGMIDQAIAAGAGVHEGAHSGQVSVEVKQEVGADEGEEGEASSEVEYRLIFEHYSEDGEIFLDGVVKIEYETEGEEVVCSQVRGELQISGKYEVRVFVDRILAGELVKMGKLHLSLRS